MAWDGFVNLVNLATRSMSLSNKKVRTDGKVKENEFGDVEILKKLKVSEHVNYSLHRLSLC